MDKREDTTFSYGCMASTSHICKGFCYCVISDMLSCRFTFSLITPCLCSSLASDFLKFQKMMDHLME